MHPFLAHEISRQRHAADVAFAAEYRRAREVRQARRARDADDRRSSERDRRHPSSVG